MGHQILAKKKLQGKVQNLGGRIVYLFLGNNSQVLYQYLIRTNLVVTKAIQKAQPLFIPDEPVRARREHKFPAVNTGKRVSIGRWRLRSTVEIFAILRLTV